MPGVVNRKAAWAKICSAEAQGRALRSTGHLQGTPAIRGFYC
jgi:hypothetical protein